MKAKQFTKIFVLLLVMVFATSAVSALSLDALWENQQTTITINPGDSPGYAIALSNDIGFSYTDVSVKIFDRTTGTPYLLSEIHSEKVTDRIYFSPTYYVLPEDYTNRGGQYFLDIKATELLYGQTLIRSEQLYLDAGNRGPDVYYTYVPSSPTTDDTVIFTAHASDDDGIIASYQWFVDGVNQNVNSQTFSKQFLTAKDYDVKVKVYDNDGAMAQYSEIVPVGEGTPQNQPPVANFVWNPPAPKVGETVTFTSISYDPDGTIVAYNWKINGVTASSSSSFDHIFTELGMYAVKLTVTDDDGAQNSKLLFVLVTPQPNEPPVADFVWNPTNPTVNQQVTFTSTSTDSDGTIVFYNWKINGVTASSLSSFVKTFTQPGTYSVKLTVTDDDGASDTRIRYVTVSEEPNLPPEAVIGFSPANPFVGDTVYLDGSNSYDSDGSIVSYLWKVDGTTVSYNENFNYVFNNPGTYQVSLKVTDNDGASDTDYVSVTVSEQPNLPPVASFVWSPSSPMVNEQVVFTSTSTDSDGSIVSYLWKVDGTTVSYNENFDYVFSTSGTYSVKLTVTDDDGASDSVTRQITVSDIPNLPPESVIEFSPANPFVGDTVYFDGSNSYDPDGTIVSYLWKVDGTTASYNENFNYVFGNPGTYQVSLKVTDNDGASDTDYVSVTVSEQPNLPPVADFVWSPASPFVDDDVTFTSTSTDPDGIIVSYLWKIDGTTVSYNEEFNYVFSNPGTYKVSLKVTDNDGALGTRTRYVMVSEEPNIPPIANFRWDPTNPFVGDAVTFTSTSTDSDGTIVSYLWKINNALVSQDESFIYTFNNPGTYTVKLIVTDDDGASDSITKYVTVSAVPNEPPVASFIWSPTSPMVGETVSFTSTSTDSDGTIVSFIWRIDGTTVSYNENFDYVFGLSGTYDVKLTVTDNDGASDMVTHQVIVSEEPNVPPVAVIEFSPANPFVGDTVYFDGSNSFDPDGTIVSFIWKVDGTTVSYNENFNYVFNTAGTFQVSLTVTDNDGASDTDYVSVIVSEQPNIPPVAKFVWSPTSPMVGETVAFTSTSYDPDGTIVSFVWKINGVIVSYNENFDYVFSNPSNYAVMLTVTDNDGASDSVTQNMVVGDIPNKPPVANFVWTPFAPIVGETVSFTSTSTDSDGIIVSYLWKIEGIIVSYNENFDYVFDAPGDYVMMLTVTDNDGASDSKTRTVKVAEDENQPPIAFFIWDPVIPFTGDTVTFTSTSSDPDGFIVSYLWKIDGVTVNNNEQFDYVFDAPGTYAVELTVTDNDGAQDSKTRQVVVQDITNEPPIALFTWSPTVPEVGETVFFDGSDSYDPDGTIISYLWKIDGDVVSTSVSFSIEFDLAGVYSVSLTVIDNDGASDTEIHSVQVTEIVEPQLVLDELSCNANVVQGQQQQCGTHVKDNIEDVTVKYYYSNSGELLGTCNTNFKGYCHINPIINEPIGYYEVYATAEKPNYRPDLTKLLRTTFRVWAERYAIENLKTWEDEFITEQYTFYRANPVYSSFDVLDLFTGEYVPPSAGLVKDVFLRVNNVDPANFTEFTLQNMNSNGNYRFVLDNIPISDDFLGEGKVFAFVFNFSDNTAGQDSVNVNILNNELQFEQPGPYNLDSGEFVDIDFNPFLYDIETPDNEIVMSFGDEWPFTVTSIGTNMYRVVPNSGFEGQHNILFTADDTDGSVITRSVLFNVAGSVLIPPVADFTWTPTAPFVDDDVTFVSNSYDPDGFIESYEWKVNGVTVSVQESFIHVFNAEGTYDIELTVTDNDGLVDAVIKYVTVIEQPVNIPPVADFDWTPMDPIVGDLVSFVSNAYDPDGTVVSYAWYIDGSLVSVNQDFTHTFSTQGTYEVTLVVEDNEGATGSITKFIVVGVPPPTGEPVAILSLPGSTIIGKEVVMDASASYDPNGYIVEYRWNIIQDNEIIETFTTVNPKVYYVFTERYANYVELTVVDNDGLTDTTTKRIDVGKQRGGPVSGNGKDDGLFVDYFEVFGLDRGIIRVDEPYTVSVTVTNDRDEKLNNVHATFQIPEIGYTIKSEGFDLKAGETKHIFIQDYLPFLPQEIDPGEYYALVGAAGDGIIRTKYYPLMIE